MEMYTLSKRQKCNRSRQLDAWPLLLDRESADRR